jgi:hypothetical protein
LNNGKRSSNLFETPSFAKILKRGSREPNAPRQNPSCAFHAAIALLASVYFLDFFATLFLIPELKGEPPTD